VRQKITCNQLFKMKSFLPDQRNMGGKCDIERLQQNHMLALINAKSQINTHKPPRPHVNKTYFSQKKNLQSPEEFREVTCLFY
jgi:hypothetical protein